MYSLLVRRLDNIRVPTRFPRVCIKNLERKELSILLLPKLVSLVLVLEPVFMASDLLLNS